MKINYAKAYQLFESEMAKKKKEYLAAGATEEDFFKYYWMRKAELNRDLAYERRKVPLSGMEKSFDEESRNALYLKSLEKLSVEMDLPSVHKFWWIDQVENEKLLRALLSFSEEELTLIDMKAFQGLTQADIAEITGRSQAYISKTLNNLYQSIKISLGDAYCGFPSARSLWGRAAKSKTHMRQAVIRKRIDDGGMEMCLCSVCANTFYNTPGYRIRRKDHYQTEKDLCDFCNSRYGFDYLVNTGEMNVRKRLNAGNRTLEKKNENGYSRDTSWRSAAKPIISGNN